MALNFSRQQPAFSLPASSLSGETKARHDMKLYRGDDESRTLWLFTQISGEKRPLDLSQMARIDLHAEDEQGDIVLKLSSTTGEIQFNTPSQATGEVGITIPHALTATATWTQAKYDLQLTDHQGRIKTVLVGRMELIYDTTRLAH